MMMPRFGYALALAILLKDYNANYVERRFSICKQNVFDTVHNIFNIDNIPYGPMDCAENSQFVPLPELHTNRCRCQGKCYLYVV